MVSTTPTREDRSRGVTTLKSMTNSPNQSLVEMDKNFKERQNQVDLQLLTLKTSLDLIFEQHLQDTKSEERGETDFQGNPSILLQQVSLGS